MLTFIVENASIESEIHICPASGYTKQAFKTELRCQNFSLRTSHSTLQSPHFTIRTSHCFFHTPNLTLHTALFTPHTSHCILHTPHFFSSELFSPYPSSSLLISSLFICHLFRVHYSIPSTTTNHCRTLDAPKPIQLTEPSCKDNSIAHEALAPSNLDAAITMRSAKAELQNTVELRTTGSEIAAAKPDLDVKAYKSRFWNTF